jgi:hypothetical protein
MAAIIIKSENAKHLKLLAELAEQLGEKVGKLTTTQMEDLQLGLLMKKEKTGKSASREAIFKLLDRK